MTNEDKEAMKEFLNGFLGVCGVIVVFLVLAYFLTAGTTETQTPPNERFKVVDKYNGCNVVRYSPSSGALYKYFLDCPTHQHIVK
tara:strand:- start:442 stop:696 length:255 start_codon:yes stop_codon:yes gene_type:complete